MRFFTKLSKLLLAFLISALLASPLWARVPPSPLKANRVKVDVTNFVNNLGSGDITVQLALEALDAVVGSGATKETTQDHSWDVLGGTQTLITVTYQDATDDVDFVVENDLNLYDWTNVDGTDLKTGSVTQAWDADLDTYAGITPAANVQSLLSAADYAAMLVLLNLEAGTDFYDIASADAAFQPLEATLTDIADGTIGEDLVNTSFPWANNEVADDITLTDITQITNRAITSVTATNWRIFYSGAGGVPIELVLGANGSFLESNGASAAPAFRTLVAGDIPDLSGTYQPLDDDLTDLADGELSGSLVEANSSTSAGVVATGSGQNAQVWKTDASGVPGWRADATGGTPAFSDITTGTNTTATMTLGAGGTLTYTSTGVVNANQFAGVSSINATEFGYLNGVTSSIQTQMDANAPDDAKYILQQADGELANAQALSALSSGLMYVTTTTGAITTATESQVETTLGIGFGASKAPDTGFILIMDGTDLESVAMSGDVTIIADGTTTVGDDSHAHVVGNIDAANSSVWIDQVSDSNGTGLMVFGTAPTFTTSIAFNAVSDTIAGIENQNLVDKTAAEEIGGDWERQDNIPISFGDDNDWEIDFTGTILAITHTAAAAADVTFDLNDNAADSVFSIINSDGGYKANLTVDGVISQDGSLLSATYQPLHALLTDLAGLTLTVGDVIYYDGSNFAKLDSGTNGYFLQAQGAAAPAWAEGSSTGVNETYGVGWDGDTSAPEKDDVYDILENILNGTQEFTAITMASSTDPKWTFNVTDAEDTDWSLGTNADADASSDDFFEFRQHGTEGNLLSYTLDPTTGDIRLYGVAGGTGGDDAYYTLLDVANPTANRTITIPDADVVLANIAVNTTHKSSDGSDHTFLDQSVISGATPTFTATNITGFSAAAVGTASPSLDDTDASVEWEDAGDLDSDGTITDGAVDFSHFSAGAKFQSLAVADLNDAATPSVLTAAETTNKVISNYKLIGADHVFTMPAPHAAGNVIFPIGDEFQVDIEPDTDDLFYLNGTAMAANEHIQNTADTLGERIVGYCANINGTLRWMFYSSNAAWVEETP